MESSDSDVECGALFGQIRPYQLEPYAARRPEGEEVAAGVDVVRVGNTDWLPEGGHLTSAKLGNNVASGQGRSKMPLFKNHSTKNSKKKLQHQMYLAKECPEPTFDLSNCDLSVIPSGVFSLCKVLQKEALLVHNNQLESLHDGGTMDELVSLRVLDLHCNVLVRLPSDLGLLECLQVLNVENNMLVELPTSIGCLHRLQTLMAKGNKFKEIPESLCQLTSLRTLDVSSNRVHRLSKSLCRVRTLEKLILDADSMIYPPAAICGEGTQSIMSFLCHESGVEYIPPSKFVLGVLDPPTMAMSNSQSVPSLSSILADNLTETVVNYEILQASRRRDSLALERQLERENEMQTQLALQAAANRQHLVEYLAADQDRMSGELNAIQQCREKEREKLMEVVYQAEKNAAALVHELMRTNLYAKKTEELADEMERQRMQAEEWFTVHQSEIENLRKCDITLTMQLVLQEKARFAALISQSSADRDEAILRCHQFISEVDGKVVKLLTSKQIEQDEFVERLTTEEALQKEVFLALQMQKDTRTMRLSKQIELIEQQLSQLSVLECEQRAKRVDVQQNLLSADRRQLAQLLLQLLAEHEERQQQLMSRMVELDEHKLDMQTDYWLVQIQRLMDRKPQSLIDMEKGLEFAVVGILERASAGDYIGLMARNKISIETLVQLTDSDLEQMGIHEMGLRHLILREIDIYRQNQDDINTALKLKAMNEPQDEWLVKPPSPVAGPAPEPTAPPEGALSDGASPTTHVTARGLNSECVICMNAQSFMLFLNCGHVCCCEQCASPLRLCPLCRSEISQRILLSPQA